MSQHLVASTLSGPVGIGVGAVLYLAGNMFESINSNINKMLIHQYTYTIKGNWYNPKIEKIKDLSATVKISVLDRFYCLQDLKDIHSCCFYSCRSVISIQAGIS